MSRASLDVAPDMSKDDNGISIHVGGGLVTQSMVKAPEPSGAETAVVVERRGAAAWLRINRPDALNSLNPDVVSGLQQGLDRAESDPEVRCVVLTGTGRAFCAGADLKFVRRTGEDPGEGQAHFLEEVGELLNRIEAFSKPVVAAVNGLALAGGLETVLCCDIVIAAAGARLGDAHANYGLLPGGGASVRLPRKIGANRAKYLIFTGDFVAASDPMWTGLVNSVVPDGELDQAVTELVDKLAARSPLGLSRMKQLVNDGLEQPSSTGLRLELLASALHAHSDDMTEGLRAFEEKRSPQFSGR
jgi:enoyl-CoA hydratase